MNTTPSPLTGTADDPRVERLPAWARDLIRRQARDLERCERDLAQVKGEDPRPAIAVRDPYGRAFPVAWAYSDVLRFALNGPSGEDGEDHRGESIDVRRGNLGAVEVSTADGTLQVTPQASNLVTISVRSRF